MKTLQHDAELAAFIALLVRNGITSYLEVGSKFGNTVRAVANSMPKGSRIVSLDLPWGDKSSEPILCRAICDLSAAGYDAHLLLGDSTQRHIIDKAEALGPYDAILIDANHTEPYVRKDFANYLPLAKTLIAFHDIAYDKPVAPGRMPIQVKKVWDEIKHAYRHTEIKLDPTGSNGIGIIYR
jgi:predicted O-methyltransferase YrrM